MTDVLKDIHDTLDEIPDGPYRALYTEREIDGKKKYVISGITGIKTSADVAKIEEAKRKEVNEHKATKTQLAAWEGLKLSPDEVTAKLSRIEDLETTVKAGGKLPDDKIEEMANKRASAMLKSQLSPLERENAVLKKQVETLTGENGSLKGEKKQRKIHDELRKAMKDTKVLPEVEEDVLMWGERVLTVEDDDRVVTKEGVGVTPGITAASWLAEIQPKKPWWWPASQGGGSRGSQGGGGILSGAGNPWSAEGWNMTAQGKIVKEQGIERATAMAKAAGSSIGAMPPPKKK